MKSESPKDKVDNREDLTVVVSGSRHPVLFGALSTIREKAENRVAQVKTGLSLNPFQGCPVGCIYCYRFDVQTDAESEKPLQMHSPEAMIEAALGHPLFALGKTPLLLHTSTTEAFIPQTKAHTFRMLEIMSEQRLTNPIWIPTKARLNEEDVARLEALALPNLIITVTYSAMPSFVEPIGSQGRLHTIELLSRSCLKTSLHYRPIVDGWNSDPSHIKHVLEHGMKLQAITVGGLRISPGIMQEFERAGIQLPPGEWKAFKKTLSPDTVAEIRTQIHAQDSSYPWFLNTSCMISFLSSGRPDYNAHWQRPSRPCERCGCPSDQMQRCHVQTPPELEAVVAVANQLGVAARNPDVTPDGIFVDGNPTAEQLVALRQQMGMMTIKKEPHNG